MPRNTIPPKTEVRGLAPPLLTHANAGVSVTLGTLRFQLPSSGNRSLQIATSNGLPANLQISNINHGGGSGVGTISLTVQPNSFTYVKSSWDFQGAGNTQYVFIKDITNARWYSVGMEIGSAYNNNLFWGQELPSG